MEASRLVSRSFRITVSKTSTCECRSTSISPISLALPIRQRAVLHKTFSTSTRRRQDANVKPPKSAPKPSTASPRTSSPKHELRQYVNSLQTIIDGYNLKSRLPPRQHESLVVALTNAEVRLDAPRAHPDSFAPLLESLRSEIEPVLRINLGSSDMRQLIGNMDKQKDIPLPVQQPKEPPPPSAEKTTQKSMSSKLDAVMGTPKPASAPKPVRNEDNDGPLGTLDSLWQYYASKSSEERDAANIARSDPFRARSSEEDGERQRRDLTLSIQERLERSDAAFLARNRGANVQRPSLRLKPSLGRTVDISGNFDVNRAFRSLEAACNRNKIKQDLYKQRFHVRRGQLKKQMKMSRWRKLFKEGFVSECDRVRRMRRQGW